MKRLLSATLKLSALVALMAPASALACPYCVTQNKDAGLTGVVLLGAMIVLPFIIFIAVVPALRRAAAEDTHLFPSDSE